MVESFGLKIQLIEGEENNFKITKPLDLLLAEKIIEMNFGAGTENAAVPQDDNSRYSEE